MPRTIEGFGWIPDPPDPRDIFFTATLEDQAQVKSKIDLRNQISFEPYDQLKLGSCTANAIGAAIEIMQGQQGMAETFTPSRLFIYYNERVAFGTVDRDSGAFLRDGLKSIAQDGFPPEEDWPYPDEDASHEDQLRMMRKKPTAAVFTKASERKALLYRRVDQQLSDMRVVLSLGFPFVFGFSVFDSFMTNPVAESGKVPMPALSEGMVGGHAVLAVGYNDAKQHFIFLNSWGKEWGDEGYGYMPYAYLQSSQLASDFWTIQLVE